MTRPEHLLLYVDNEHVSGRLLRIHLSPCRGNSLISFANCFKLLLLCLFALAFLHTQAAAMPGGGENRFSLADTDKDGFLSPAEFAAAFSALKPEAFSLIDKDGDGRISPEEWRAFSSGHSMGRSAPKSQTASPGSVLPILPIPLAPQEKNASEKARPGTGPSTSKDTGETLPLLTPPGK